MSKCKILICSHSAALHSGLSETLRHIFIPLIQKYGQYYDVHQLGYFHFGIAEQVPWPIYPTRVNQSPQGPQIDHDDRWGAKSFDPLVAELKPDLVFGYGDMWHFEPMLNSPHRNSYRFCAYYTIDGQPYYGHLEADGSTDWGKRLTKADQIVVLSHFGKEVLKGNPELKDKDIKVMYHPLDMARYPNLSDAQRLDIRDKILPKHLSRSSFIAGWCGKNQFRKQNHKLWEIAHYMIYGDYIQCKDCNRVTTKEWEHTTRQIKNPDKFPGELHKITMYDRDYRYDHCWYCKSRNIAQGVPNPNFLLWFHMSKEDPGYHPDLHERMWNITNNCVYTKNLKGLSGAKATDLALLMAAWDCHLYPSGGEGFGNPPFESMAAGTPIVYSDYSSHSEFCKFGGLPIRVTYQPEMVHGIQRAVVDTNHAIEQLLKLVHNPALRKDLGVRGRMHASQYNLGSSVDAWHKTFQEMMQKPIPAQGQQLYSTVI